MKIIPYGKQHISAQDIQAVVSVLKEDFLTQGPKVKEFEEKFASYVGAKYAVSVSNGTAALHLSALSLGVNQSSKVITTPITFAASANAIGYCGGTIEFCDIDPNTLCLDINAVRKKLETSPKGTYQGIIPVDFAGYAVNMESFRELADQYDLWLLEDSCHSPGGYFRGFNNQIQKCGNGNFADAAIFSFHPVKHIACGEGGMITTNNKSIYEKLLLLRTHGITKQLDDIHRKEGWYYEMKTLGFNYRLPDILCALGISQLETAAERLDKRKELANRYINAFRNTSIKIPLANEQEGHAYHLFVIRVKNRLELYNYLREKNIFCQVHYIPVHQLTYYKEVHGSQSFPFAESYYSECLSLPMFPTLSEREQDFVIQEVLNFID